MPPFRIPKSLEQRAVESTLDDGWKLKRHDHVNDLFRLVNGDGWADAQPSGDYLLPFLVIYNRIMQFFERGCQHLSDHCLPFFSF